MKLARLKKDKEGCFMSKKIRENPRIVGDFWYRHASSLSRRKSFEPNYCRNRGEICSRMVEPEQQLRSVEPARRVGGVPGGADDRVIARQ